MPLCLCASSQYKTRSAASKYFQLTSIPNRSTRSSLSRRPAVSTSRNGKPSIAAYASIASRVVPGTSVTIARSRPSRALNSDDLPALGGPAMTSSAPSRNRSPSGAVRSSSATRSRATRHAAVTRSGRTGPSSSSGKSISYAINPSSSRISLRNASSRRERPRSSCCSARRRCAGAPASIKSAVASACSRSIFPFNTARRVNSPGSAGRAPAAASAATASAGTSRPPWVESSTRSSPV